MNSAWKKVKLGDVSSMTSGGTPSSLKSALYGGTIPWLRTQEVNFNYIRDTEIKITESGFNSSSTKWIPKNSVIVAMYGNSAGRVAYTLIDLTTNQACCNITVNNQLIDSKFLYFNLMNRYSEIRGLANGGAQQNLNVGIIKNLVLPLPPLPIQQSIAKILSSLDDKIELLREQNKTLEALAQTLFKRWFVDFEFPNDAGMPYKSSGGKMVESELGLIPEGWRVGILNDYIGELESGRRPKGGVGDLRMGVPSVGAESINGIVYFDFSRTKYISKEFFNKMKSGKVKDYDILVYKDGTFIPRFSMSGEGFPFKFFAINEHVFRIQPKYFIQRFYLYLYFNTFRCKKELQNIGGKAAIPGINATDFRNLSLLKPTDVCLHSFDRSVSGLFRKILKNNVYMFNLLKTKNALLPILFNEHSELVKLLS